MVRCTGQQTIGLLAVPDLETVKRPEYVCPLLKKTVSPGFNAVVPLLTCAIVFQGLDKEPLAVDEVDDGST